MSNVENALDHILPVLERTPATLRELLTGLPQALTTRNEGPETWSAVDVLGHLVVGEETDWMARAGIIRTHGESRAFDPFDRFGQFSRFRTWSLERLLGEFTRLRAANLDTLRSWKLTPEDLELRGTHPDFGPVTLGELLATWAVHDLGHIAQIARVMAKQHAGAVGPWKAYLPVLTRR